MSRCDRAKFVLFFKVLATAVAVATAAAVASHGFIIKLAAG